MDAYTLMAADAGIGSGLAGTNALPHDGTVGRRDRSSASIRCRSAPQAGHRFLPSASIRLWSPPRTARSRPITRKAAHSGGWAFDADGQPDHGRTAAIAGLIQPIRATIKGVGLGMAVRDAFVAPVRRRLTAPNPQHGRWCKGGTDGHFCAPSTLQPSEDLATFRIASDLRSSNRCPFAARPRHGPPARTGELEGGIRDPPIGAEAFCSLDRPSTDRGGAERCRSDAPRFLDAIGAPISREMPGLKGAWRRRKIDSRTVANIQQPSSNNAPGFATTRHDAERLAGAAPRANRNFSAGHN